MKVPEEGCLKNAIFLYRQELAEEGAQSSKDDNYLARMLTVYLTSIASRMVQGTVSFMIFLIL